MLGKGMTIGTGIATAVVAVAIAAPGGTAPLDHHSARTRPARTAIPAWQLGLDLRSQALNRRYKLGQFALSPSSADTQPSWQRALFLRSDALNRMYGLGAYAKAGG
jgi:hypothetical protein